MEKRVRLFDYKNKEHFFIIKDFENVDGLIFEIISGDGILTVFYKDEKEVEFDTGEHRIISFYDGMWFIDPKDIDVLNRMKNHYDMDELNEVG